MKFRNKFRALFHRSRFEREMAEELRVHVEMREAENRAQGMAPDDARAVARRQFGAVDPIKETAREQRGFAWLDSLRQDLRYGLRALGRNPLFTGIAVATLALGIGANVAVFSVLNALLLRPLPYREADRLVALWERHPRTSDHNVVSAGNFLDWQEQNTVFEGLAAYGSFGAKLKTSGPPQSAAGARITPNLLGLLGVRPLPGGRGFSEGAGAEAEGPEIIVSHAFWQNRLGGRPDAVGTVVEVNDAPMTVVGVMPAGFEFPARGLDFWLPLRPGAEDRESRRSHEWRVLGRLKPGVSLAAAQAAMENVVARVAAAHPQFMDGWGINVVSYRADLVRGIRPTVLILGGVVALVLLVACANVANLMLARAAGRQRELAIRGALGAGRGRIARQLLTEAGLLAGLGMAAGLGLACGTLPFLAALMPGGLPGIAAPTLDRSALGFAMLTMVAATAIVGLAPAWWLGRTELRSFLQGGRTETGGRFLQRTRNGLLVTQLALATMLLMGAGLLLRSMARLQRVDFGFDPQHLLVATVDLPEERYPATADQAAFFERVRERLQSLPGVVAVAGISDPPLSGSSTFSYVVANHPRSGPNPRENPVEERSVSPDYFQTARVRQVAGRGFTASDRADSPRVAVVNQAFARLHFAAGEAVGQRLSFVGTGGPWLEIVGVVGDVKDAGHDQPAAPAIYTPYAQKRLVWQSALTLMLRTSGDPDLLREDVRRVLTASDGELAAPRIATMAALYAGRLAQRDFMTKLISGFAALTLSLGVIGVYGVIAYAVAQRRREFGICLALGAGRRHIIQRVMGGGVKLVVLGAALGAIGASTLTRFLRSLLFEVQPLDPLTFAGVVALLGGVSLLALWFPARQASHVDPMIALRCE
jgi:putative ABC transport system permease protein